MVGTGITAQNPNYENTKSPIYQTNVMTAMLLSLLPMQLGFIIADMGLGIVFHIDFVEILQSILGPIGTDIFLLLQGPLIILTIGILMMRIGSQKLSQPSN